MRVAFFSPLPPARSGIADYSAALISAMAPFAEVETFSTATSAFDPAQFDIALYQIGNNGFHAFAYEAALRHPGVVALHESNLHHLMADLTIRRGDWDGYIRECEYNGGPEARAFAERVRKLEAGPDYEGVRMTRRLLESARGVVVHSRFLSDEVRAAGYAGPVAVIPHGAWIPDADRNAYRDRLGLDESTPLVGAFGFLKPYKRLAECLRAFSRLARIAPGIRMILVGEEHPDFPLTPLIRSLGLSAQVRVLGFTPPEDFTGYMAACDIVANLRYPTVGESSGTLLRAMGLGKPALVSEVGSFQEFPDDVCLKVAVGAGEEDLIFEYLSLLISRPDLAREIGARARDYVARECNWQTVAEKYLAFMTAVVSGEEWGGPSGPPPGFRPALAPQTESVTPTEDLAPYLRTWAPTGDSRTYLEVHETRLVKTLQMVPPGGPEDRILEMGTYLQITPALRTKLGYKEVRGCYYGPSGRIDLREIISSEGERFACEVDHFNAEKDAFPYPDGYFATVLCCELIEHLAEDPMHMLCEINRVLKLGGHLLITTPNIAALRGISAILQGYHPGFYHAYIRPAQPDEEVDARHNREYTPREVSLLLANSGFEIAELETGEFRDRPHPEYGWVMSLLERYRLDTRLRGDGIYALGRKIGPVRERYPAWLYS